MAIPDVGQVKAQQSYPKDHQSSKIGPMRIFAPPQVQIDDKLGSSCKQWEVLLKNNTKKFQLTL
jgi:hypothetical protein